MAMPSGKVLMSTTGMDTNLGAAEVVGVEVFAAVVEEDTADGVAEGFSEGVAALSAD